MYMQSTTTYIPPVTSILKKTATKLQTAQPLVPGHFLIDLLANPRLAALVAEPPVDHQNNVTSKLLPLTCTLAVG